MISIVLDGRNDTHGHNSHRRVALSLNCLASVLSEHDDEIVFVDYNSDEDVPTLPEAIDDLLTAHARDKLRVLRVPPAVHRRLALPGAGNLLDTIARNVGLRRTNPANRWILSTTSDIVVVPRQAEQSLSEICRDLPDRFHALPRFEVPEFLWEATDRHDPQAILASFAEWGPRFHLNESVLGVPEAMFDACGDFQLFLRRDAFAIGGFDERMVAGWQHSDTNLQRRLALLRGGVTDFTDRAFAYHCDHMRQAAAVHRRDRLENDWDLFVAGIQRPELPFQLQDWGLPGEAIPEIRLTAGRTQTLVSAVAASIEPSETTPSVASRDHSSYDLATIPVAHVFPFLADHFATLLPGARVLYVGANPEMLQALARLVASLGTRVSLLVNPFPPTAGVQVGLPVSPSIGPDQGAQSTDDCALCIFDFSVSLAERQDRIFFRDLSRQEANEVAAVRQLFLAETARERLRLRDGAGSRRKFVVLNAVHTSVESLVDGELEAVLTPFSTRIRHGYVKNDGETPAITIDEVVRALGEKAERAVLPGELSLVLSVIASCRRGQPVDEIPDWAITRGLLAALDVPRLVAACNLDRAAADALRAKCKAALGLSSAAGASSPGDPGTTSRLCDFRDWDNPAWRASARRYAIGAERVPYHRRHRSTWERIQMFHAAGSVGRLDRESRVAVISVDPDELTAGLVDHVGAIDLIPYGTSADPAEWQRQAGPAHRQNCSLVKGGMNGGRIGRPKYDVVFVPQNTAFLHGHASLEEIVRFAEQTLVEGGLLIFSAEFVIEAQGPHPWWGGGPDECRAIVEALENSSGFTVVGQPGLRPSSETLSRQATLAESLAAQPHAVLIDGAHRRTSSVWVCRRTGAIANASGQHLAALLNLNRNMLYRTSTTEASSWQAGVLRVDPAAPPGLVARSPDVSLPAGKLRLSLHGTPGPAGLAAPAVLEVVSNRLMFLRRRRRFTASELTTGLPITLNFSSRGRAGELFEFRLLTSGGSDFSVHRIEVGRI